MREGARRGLKEKKSGGRRGLKEKKAGEWRKGEWGDGRRDET